MKIKPRCNVCGITLNEENAFELDGDILCEHCLEERSVICDCCGERISRNRADGDEYTTLCNNCYIHRYTTCENCGILIRNDNVYYLDDEDDYQYCYECYQKIVNRAIKNYSYKPKTIFYGDGNLFYGIELEIDKGGECDDNAQRILDIGKGDEKLSSPCMGF